MSLRGNSVVYVYPVSAIGSLGAIPEQVTAQDIANLGAGSPFGNKWFVDTTNGSDTNNGQSSSTAFSTIGEAVDNYEVGDTIVIAPGSYDETVTVTRPSTGSAVLTFIGAGPVGSVAIAPTTTDAGALINDADDVTMINVGCAANGTGTAIVNTGSRFRSFTSKFENDDGTGLCVQMTLGTVAQRAAHSKGSGADCLLDGCEFAWAASGLKVTGTDYGALTELVVRDCYFHDLDTKHILESVGSGGSAAVTYASLLVEGCTFGRDEAGTEPTDYIILNANNANSGVVTGCSFPTALSGGKNLVSTKLIWTGNLHTGGISTGQPS